MWRVAERHLVDIAQKGGYHYAPFDSGLPPAGAILVRPDGHVTWRHRTAPNAGEPTAQAQLLDALTASTGTTQHRIG